jgi:hypothetical protein
LIGDIAASGTAMAVLSNAPSSMGRLVEAQPWAGAFRQLFFSGDLGLIKPDPQIYRHLLKNLGSAPGEVVFLAIEPTTSPGPSRQVFTASSSRTLRKPGRTCAAPGWTSPHSKAAIGDRFGQRRLLIERRFRLLIALTAHTPPPIRAIQRKACATKPNTAPMMLNAIQTTTIAPTTFRTFPMTFSAFDWLIWRT